MRFALLALAVVVGINWQAARLFKSPFPSAADLRLSGPDAVESAALWSVGMRRLAADLECIRLLMYYGESEIGEEEEDAFRFGAGRYPQIKPRVDRIMALDPYFSYAALYGAGALAFNIRRTQEALDILRTASERDPKEWKYRLYQAAIAAKEKGDTEQVVRELAPLVDDPNAPTMLKNMLAYLNRTLGHREEAIRIYRKILDSGDPSYHAVAGRALSQLGG